MYNKNFKLKIKNKIEKIEKNKKKITFCILDNSFEVTIYSKS